MVLPTMSSLLLGATESLPVARQSATIGLDQNLGEFSRVNSEDTILASIRE
jgi:hypothetical protein